MLSKENTMVKIDKLFNRLIAVLILSYSSIALSKTNLEALRDSFLCKGVNSRAEQVKLLKPFILKQKKNLITLKQPIVFGNVQSNLVNVVLGPYDEIDQLHLMFKVDYRKVQKNLPVKLHRGRTMEEDQGNLIVRMGRNLLVLNTEYSPEYPTALICQYER